MRRNQRRISFHHLRIAASYLNRNTSPRYSNHETTFEHDVADRDVLRAWLMDLTEQVAWRLRRYGLRGRTVRLKVRFADFSTITRSHTLPEPTNITDELWRAADEMLCRRLPSSHLPVRLLGIGVGGLDDTGTVQGLLFDQVERQKQTGLDAIAEHGSVRPDGRFLLARRAWTTSCHGPGKPSA